MSRLDTGTPAPTFELTSHTGEQVALSDYAGQHVVLFFYPAAMTPGCTTEACDFRDSLEPLKAAGYAVLGISPDTTDKLTQFAEQELLSYPLLADPDKATLTAYGAWGEKNLYGKTVTGVIRSTIVIDPDGNVELAKYNVKATGHVAALRKALKIG
ncbi:thioredoxin-dependent thiol peroxidase [Dermatophilaceae bacterium Sec6.4]